MANPTQVTVGVTAVHVPHDNLESVSEVLITPGSAGKVYLGTDATVATTTGLLLPNGVVTRIPFRGNVGDVYLISDTAAQAVGVLFA